MAGVRERVNALKTPDQLAFEAEEDEREAAAAAQARFCFCFFPPFFFFSNSA